MSAVERFVLMRIGKLAVRCALLGALAAGTLGAAGSARAATVPGVTGSQILLGSVFDTTGIYRVECGKELTGLQNRIAAVNAQGGINGRQVKLVNESDDGGGPKSLAAARDLVEHVGVLAIVSTCGGITTDAVLPYTEAHHVPLMVADSQFLSGRKLQYVWSIQPSVSDLLITPVKYAAQYLHSQKIGVIVAQESLSDHSLSDMMGSVLQALHSPGKIADFAPFIESPTSSFDATIARMRSEGIDTVFGLMDGSFGPVLMRAVRRSGWTPAKGIVVFSDMNSRETWDAAGTALAARCVVEDAVDLTLTGPYMQRYLAASHTTPATFDKLVYQGYAEAEVALDALRVSGSDLSRESLRYHMTHSFLHFSKAFSPVFTLTPTHFIGLSQIAFFSPRNGRMVQMSRYLNSNM